VSRINKKVNAWIFALGALILGAAAVATIVIFNSIIQPPFWEMDFDSIQWQLRPELRARMVNDLVISDKLSGKTLPEVVAMLGSGYESGHMENRIGYATMNPYQNTSIDHEVMVVVFDSSGRVDSVFIDLW
jgi:hypothetical protein